MRNCFKKNKCTPTRKAILNCDILYPPPLLWILNWLLPLNRYVALSTNSFLNTPYLHNELLVVPYFDRIVIEETNTTITVVSKFTLMMGRRGVVLVEDRLWTFHPVVDMASEPYLKISPPERGKDSVKQDYTEETNATAIFHHSKMPIV